MSDEEVSKLLWLSRNWLETLTNDMPKGIVDVRDGLEALELIRDIDKYRKLRGWSPNGYGGESEQAFSVYTQLQLFEDRLRANHIHDPGCPVLLRRDDMDKTFQYVDEVDCTCWLNEEAKT